MTHILLIAMLLLADDSTLVKAAKANGGLKKPIPKKTITNADVKKSTGKITALPANGVASGSASAPEAGAPTLAQFAAQKKARADAEKRVADAETNVIALEKELGRIEQSYYEAEDPNYRDTTIVARFNQTQKQLDSARKELSDARDALAALTPKPRDSATPQPQ